MEQIIKFATRNAIIFSLFTSVIVLFKLKKKKINRITGTEIQFHFFFAVFLTDV